jgi:hypothetical protein
MGLVTLDSSMDGEMRRCYPISARGKADVWTVLVAVLLVMMISMNIISDNVRFPVSAH